MSINSVMLTGTIIRRESREFANGLKATRFTLKTGDGKQAAYIRCTAFGKTAEKVEAAEENSGAAVSGRLSVDSYTGKDGKTVTNYETIVSDVVTGTFAPENTVLLSGRTVRDAEVRTGEKGSATRFTVAVDRSTKEKQEKQADFIGCVFFGQRPLAKGAMVLLRGHLHTGSYEKDGQKIYTTDVVVDSLAAADSAAPAQKQESASSMFQTPDNNGFMPIPEGFSELEDDLPFN